MAPSAEIIGTTMHDDGALSQHMSAFIHVLASSSTKDRHVETHQQTRITYSQNTLRPDQFDQRVGDGGFGIALSIGREVA